MAENYVLLETIALTQSAASIVFDNIPQTGYTDLRIVMSARGNGTGFGTSPWENCSITLNGTSATSTRQLYATVAGIGSDSQGAGIWMSDNDATANVYSNNEILIPNYLSTNAKSLSADSATENNGTDAARVLWHAAFTTVTTAVSSITIAAVSGSLLAGSTFSLYGIAAFGTEPVTAPLATGGNIVVNDGTYWYHAFLSSGTFVPHAALSCDYLVVAGGGSGSSYENAAYAGGAGGGAGGLRSTVTATGGGGSLESPIALNVGVNYSVLVGAGGAGGTSNTRYRGNNGSNSVFSTITAIGGGGGGSPVQPTNSKTGSVGGSGGGGVDGGVGGAGTANQGYAGGAGSGDGPSYAGGGGGGASAVGGSAAPSSAGAGGNGVAISITGTSVTYAGGGGGGGQSTSASGGSGGGGNGAANTATPGSGTANTGGGGGGSGGTTNGSSVAAAAGAGGSGIVIIRYAMA